MSPRAAMVRASTVPDGPATAFGHEGRGRNEQTEISMQAQRKRTGVEWVGGLTSMPAYVTGEGQPYRPEMLVWMGADGSVLGSTVEKPGEALGKAAESLRSTIERPMCGHPHAPARVRVASPELADALRAAHPSVEIVCAPTPEIDAMLEMMRENFSQNGELVKSYLARDIDADAVASLFRAVAGLYRVQPWKIVPSDQSLFSVTIEQLGVRDAVMSVIGQAGESHGLVLFANLDDFEAFAAAADAVEHGEAPTMPPHFSLSFERGADLSPALRKEIANHHWEVAGPDAYPWPVVVDEDLVGRPPTAQELTIAEAIALALPRVLTEKQALLAAWQGGAPATRTLCVATHAGEIEVTLSAPLETRSVGSEQELWAELSELAEAGEELDHERRRELEDELVGRFAESPEAEALADIQSCHYVMDFAANYFGATIATLGPAELREVVFEIIPRKLSIEAAQARRIVEENRAFYAFLKREFGLEQADECLRVLGGDAVNELEAALSDPRNFGMAKSLFMAGHEAGFDLRLPRARKNRRKAARKARKRNR